MDPTVPSVATLPGGVTPAFGQRSLSEGEWRFDFHGLITAPLAVGIGDRAMPQPGQSGTTLHTPPAVPDDRETFSHTGVVPTTYAQLNFSQGTSVVQANMSILARQANASTSFLEPASQLGVNDLFVSVLPKLERWRIGGPGGRVREPLRLARRIRRRPLRHAADRAHQRHRRTHQRCAGRSGTGC